MDPIWQAPNFSWEEIGIGGDERPLLGPPTHDEPALPEPPTHDEPALPEPPTHDEPALPEPPTDDERRLTPSTIRWSRSVSERRLTYVFGPLERRGLLGPLRVGQAVLLAAGTLLAIVVLDKSPSAAGALIAVLAVAVAVAVSFAPLGGRTAQEWAPIAASSAARAATRRNRFVPPRR